MADTRDAVAIVATLDTKGAEVAFVSESLAERGRAVEVFDIGTAGPYATEIDLTDAAQTPSDFLAQIADRVQLKLEAMARAGDVTAVLGIAGGKGSAAFAAIVADLPYGFPKLLVSSARPALLAELARRCDILLYPTLVDLFGINAFTEAVLTNAANAIAMMRFSPRLHSDKKIVAITAFGVTTPAASGCADRIRKAGIDANVFPANGVGGQTMEKFIRAGHFDGVIDLTTTELADELLGGTASAGPERLSAACERGIPQLVAPGAVDMVNFGSPSTVPSSFTGRRFFAHTPYTTLMRTTVSENREIGRTIGSKLSDATAPVAVLWPRQGFSDYDRAEGAFADPEADQAWLAGLRETLPTRIPVIELDCHINDAAFADKAASWMVDQLIESTS